MKSLLASALMLGAIVSSPTLVAAEEPHKAGGVLLSHTEINVGMVAEGWSVVRLLRGQVINEKDEKIGYVHDAIVTPKGETSFVIVNVAGYLGIPTKLVALPASAFEVTGDEDLLLPLATRETLGNLPVFQYAN